MGLHGGFIEREFKVVVTNCNIAHRRPASRPPLLMVLSYINIGRPVRLS
jgi:hypothetical protein